MVRKFFVCKRTGKSSRGYLDRSDIVGWRIYLDEPDMGTNMPSVNHEWIMLDLGCKSFDFGIVDEMQMWYNVYPDSKLMRTMYGNDLEENLVDSSDNTDNS